MKGILLAGGAGSRLYPLTTLIEKGLRELCLITTRQVVRLIEERLRPARKFEFWAGDEEFYRVAARTPRSNSVMDVTKLLAAGVPLRPVAAALDDSLARWVPERI